MIIANSPQRPRDGFYSSDRRGYQKPARNAFLALSRDSGGISQGYSRKR